MGYRERRDRLSRELGATNRRLRRELDWVDTIGYGAVSSSTDVGYCPNVGPSNAGNEICTIQSSSTRVAGNAYNIVSLAAVQVVPGTDLISYCFEGKVGPGSGPVEVFCDGTWGLLDDGLIYREGFNYEGGWQDESLSEWGTVTGDWTLVTSSVDQITRLLGQPTGLIKNAMLELRDFSTTHNEAAFQFRTVHRVTGDNRPSAGGMGINFDISAQLPTDTYWGGAAYTISNRCMIVEINNAAHSVALDSNNFNDGCTWWCNISTALGGLIGLGSSVHQRHMGGQINNSQSGLPKNSTEHSLSTRHGYISLVVDNSSGIYPFIDNTGRYFWDMKATKNGLLRVQGAPSTDYFLRIYHRYHGWFDPDDHSYLQATTGGLHVVDGEYWDWPFDGIEVWKSTNHADPQSTGTVVVEYCAPARGYWPGDLWTYSTAGTLSSTQVFAGDARATVQLEFLDSTGGTLTSYEPAGVQSEGYSRSGSVYLGAPVPFNAASMKFTPYKVGTADAWACVRQLQVNTGDLECCVYSAPQSGAGSFGITDEVAIAGLHYVDLDADLYEEPYVEYMWDSVNSTLVEGWQVDRAYVEHRTGSANLVVHDGYDIHAGPGTGSSGAPVEGEGYEYDEIDLATYDLSSGDAFSIRFHSRVKP